MADENPEASSEISPLISSAPAHVGLTPKQRRVLIFLAFAVPLWLILSGLAIASPLMLFVFLAGIGFLIVFYGMRTEYLLFLWFAMTEYDLLVKAVGLDFFGIGLKGLFFAGMLTQLPNKFSLMPRKLFRLVPARWPWYVLIIWIGLSLFWSDSAAYGFRLYIRWLTGFFAYAMVFLTINERNKRLFFIIYALVIGSSVCYGLAQRFGFGIELQDVTLFAPQDFTIGAGETMFRAAGFSGSPNGMGRECAYLSCVLLMMLFSWRLRRSWQAVIVGMLGITMVVTLLSYSRVGWGLFAVGVGVFVLIHRPRWIIPIMLAGLVIAALAWSQVWERIGPVLSGTDASLQVRSQASRIYLEFWKLRPITGYGLGSTGGGALLMARIWPHEGYVYLLSFFGLVGLLLYAWVLLALLKTAVRTMRNLFVRADEELRSMAALGLACAIMLALDFVVAIGPYMQTYYLFGASFGALRIAWQRQAQQSVQPAAPAPAGAEVVRGAGIRTPAGQTAWS